MTRTPGRNALAPHGSNTVTPKPFKNKNGCYTNQQKLAVYLLI